MRLQKVSLFVIAGLLSVSIGQAAEWGLKEGTPAIKSATSLVFGPDGILFIGDSKSASVFAIDTRDTKGDASKAKINVSGLNTQVAALLATAVEKVTISDISVNPLTGNVFVAVNRTEGGPAIIRVDSDSKLTQIALEKIPFQEANLPNAPEDKEISRNGRPMNPRNDSITDLAYAEGKVFVSGVAAGPNPSSVYQIPFPFADGISGSGVEIYHAAHGRREDNAAIRTFVPLNINGEASLLAGFQCTPLVRFPLGDLKPGNKTVGTTVAELGNRNRPLDMIAYQRDGKTYLLMANSARGVMKVSTDNITRADGLTAPVPDGKTAGQAFESIKDWDGVIQLDRLNNTQAVILVQSSPSSPSQDLRTVPLP